MEYEASGLLLADTDAEEVNLELWLVCCDQWANLEHVALEAR